MSILFDTGILTADVRVGRSMLAAVSEQDFMTITIYSKPDCHLCDLAKDVVERCRKKADFTLEVIDISQNPEFLERYRYDIPVILLDGKEIARHFVRERQLLQLVQ